MTTFAATGPWPATDPLERTPVLVRTLKMIDPRGDTAHLIRSREVLKVDWLEADRRGVAMTTECGCSVSLHPSEFEVLTWADGPT